MNTCLMPFLMNLRLASSYLSTLPTNLAEDYYKILEAPEKELVWFEHSGHGPWLNETES